MPHLLSEVMDPRLLDLFALWRDAFPVQGNIGDPLQRFAAHKDHLLVIDMEGRYSRYSHYGQSFVEQFGTDLTGEVIDVLPTEVLPADQRSMLAFEYTFARRVQRPLWRSYTARFGRGGTETWQRLVLPAGGGRLVVGAYRMPPSMPSLDTDSASGLLRLLIERVPVVIDDSGRVLDLAISLKSFSATQQQMAELKVLATRDPLTGTANLRQFHHLAALELDHARLMGRSFSILALDIDHFKRINDSFGHAIGDDALRAFVGGCRAALREPDILGRCGGEEFAVALPNTPLDSARIIAERLRQQVEQLRVPLPDGQTFGFTVSVGVATLHPDSPDADEVTVPALLARADAALYRSKSAGRNSVTLASEDDPALERQAALRAMTPTL